MQAEMTLGVTTPAHSHQQFEACFDVGETCDLVSSESTIICHACVSCHNTMHFYFLVDCGGTVCTEINALS